MNLETANQIADALSELLPEGILLIDPHNYGDEQLWVYDVVGSINGVYAGEFALAWLYDSFLRLDPFGVNPEDERQAIDYLYADPDFIEKVVAKLGEWHAFAAQHHNPTPPGDKDP